MIKIVRNYRCFALGKKLHYLTCVKGISSNLHFGDKACLVVGIVWGQKIGNSSLVVETLISDWSNSTSGVILIFRWALLPLLATRLGTLLYIVIKHPLQPIYALYVSHPVFSWSRVQPSTHRIVVRSGVILGTKTFAMVFSNRWCCSLSWWILIITILGLRDISLRDLRRTCWSWLIGNTHLMWLGKLPYSYKVTCIFWLHKPPSKFIRSDIFWLFAFVIGRVNLRSIHLVFLHLPHPLVHIEYKPPH